MDRSEEKQTKRADRSASDSQFEMWENGQILHETSEMPERSGDVPELDFLIPSEELYQRIIEEARRRGLLHEEDENKEQIQVDERKISYFEELSDRKRNKNKMGKSEKEKSEDVPRKTSGKEDSPKPGRKYTVMKWAAMIAITLLGVFGVSMSSEANRAYVMNRVDEMFGNDVNVKINNKDKIISSDTTEEQDRQIIENTLGMKIPTFYYMPDGMEYLGYDMDEESGIAYIQYSIEESILNLVAMNNDNASTAMLRIDKGMQLECIEGELNEITIDLWKIEEAEDTLPTYIAQWGYKNFYYRLSGKIDVTEMEEIVKNIMYQ